MARSSLRDPLDKFRWTVSIEGFSKLGFHSTSVPGYSITTKKYKEGGAHLTPRKIVDSVEYKPVTLSRGVTNDTSFNRWATGAFDLVTNNAAFQDSSNGELTVGNFLSGAQNNGASPVKSFIKNRDSIGSLMNSEQNVAYRRDVKIEHTNRAGQVEVMYILHGAFPIEYTPASDFNSLEDGEVSIESITLEYESFEVLYSGFAGALANILT